MLLHHPCEQHQAPFRILQGSISSNQLFSNIFIGIVYLVAVQ